MSPLHLTFDPINIPGVLVAKLWVKEGSRADPIGQKGVHQLLGSLLNRGCGPYNHISLADLIEGCGAGLRCETYEDALLISLKCSEKDAERLLPVLGWMITRPHLDLEQIKIEKELTIQALKRQQENPFHLAFDSWRQMAYRNGPYNHDPLGVIEDLKQLDREEIFALSKKLRQKQSILAIAGNYNSSFENKIRFIEPINELLRNNKNKSSDLQGKIHYDTKAKPNQNISFKLQSTEQVVLMLGQSTIPHGHNDDLALRLLSCHLGVGMSSVLFVKLREENGVAYDVGVHHPSREFDAPFLIHASTTKEKAELTLNLMKEVWHKLSCHELSESELELAKAKFRGQIAHSSQTAAQRAERQAQLLGFNLPLNYDKIILKELDSITRKKLQETAKTHLQMPVLSLCGPKSSLKRLSKVWEQ